MAKEHPRYANTEWPDYEFREFPMMVYPGSNDGGKTPDRHPTLPGKFLQEAVTVNNEAELRAALNLADDADEGDKAPAQTKKPELVSTGRGTSRIKNADDEKAEAMAEAERYGVVIDKSWSVARIEDAIATYKAENGLT